MILDTLFLSQFDQVNNANSAFILINCWISQGFQSGSIGPGGPGGPGGPDSLGCPGVPDGQGGRGGRVVGRSEGQAVRWSRLSGGQGGRSVHDGQGGPSCPDGFCSPFDPGMASQGAPGGQVVTAVRVATMHYRLRPMKRRP